VISGPYDPVGITLDPQELRFALLFWDRLAWPDNSAISIPSDLDARFLQRAGILIRPTYFRALGTVADIMVDVFKTTFNDLDALEPGVWALSQGKNSLLIRDGFLIEGRGALVELHRAIPVPMHNVPLAEILEFKQRRRDELLALRQEIDTFYSGLQSSGDRDFDLQRLVAKIDGACVDLLKVSRERGLSLGLADLKASFDLDAEKMIKWAALGEAVGLSHSLPLMGGAIGGMAATLKIGKDFGVASKAFRSHPYRYVYHVHKELK
jgi:hypothetical protein